MLCPKSSVFKSQRVRNFLYYSCIFFIKTDLFLCGNFWQNLKKKVGNNIRLKPIKIQLIFAYIKLFRTQNKNGTTITIKLRNLK